MNHPADHADQTHPVSPVDDYLAQLHALVDAFVARAQELRALHKQYKAMQHEEASDERREKIMHILRAELEVLDGCQSVNEQITEFLRVQHDIGGLYTSREVTRPPERTPDARE